MRNSFVAVEDVMVLKSYSKRKASCKSTGCKHHVEYFRPISRFTVTWAGSESEITKVGHATVKGIFGITLGFNKIFIQTMN